MQDHETIGSRDKPSIGFGKKPALLLVDLYRSAFGEAPLPLAESRQLWPSSCGMAAWNALPQLVTLRDAARSAGIPIIYSRDDPTPGVRHWAKPNASKRKPANDDPRWLTRFDVIDELAARDIDLVLTKNAPSAFFGTPLAAHMLDLGVDTVIVGGESTSGCVRATVVDGCSNRLKMIVVEDCVFDRVEASHAMNLFDLNQKYSDVVSIELVLHYLRRVAGGSLAPRLSQNRT